MKMCQSNCIVFTNNNTFNLALILNSVCNILVNRYLAQLKYKSKCISVRVCVAFVLKTFQEEFSE